MSKLISFGFEIEGEMSSTCIHFLEKYGTLHGDGSINFCDIPHNKELQLREFSSFVFLNNKTQKKNVENIFSGLQKLYDSGDFHFNETCGFHIHCGFEPKVPFEIFSVEFYEYFLNKLIDTYKEVYYKRGSNRYCKIYSKDIIEKEKGQVEVDIALETERYRGINFRPALESHGTIEFRLFPSDVPKTMYKYLEFTLQTITHFIKENETLKRVYGIEFDEDISESVTPIIISEVTANLKKKKRKSFSEQALILKTETNV